MSAFGFVQSTSGGQANSATVACAAFGSNNAVGNILLAIGVGAGGGSMSSVTDTAGNTWTLIGVLNVGIVRTNVYIGEAVSGSVGCKGSANTPTGHFTAGGTNWMAVFEYSVPAGCITLDATVGQSNTSSPNATQSVTGTFGGGTAPFLIYLSDTKNASADTFTAGNGLTKDAAVTSLGGNNATIAAGSKQGTGTGSQTGSFTTTNARDWENFIIAFYPPVAPVFNQLLSTTFAGTDENPLSEGGNWHANTSTGILRQMKLASHKALQASNQASLHAQGWWVGGPTLPTNCYCEITLGSTLPDSSSFAVACICGVDGTDTQYEIVARGAFGASAGLIMAKRVAAVQTNLGAIATTTINAGDKIAIVKQTFNGVTYLTAYLNRVRVDGIGPVTDASLSTGLPAIIIQSASSVDIAGMTAGSIGAFANSLMLTGCGG